MRCARPVGSGVSPLDDELELLPGGLSARVGEGLARLAAQQPFRRAVADLAFFWGVELSEATARRHAEAAGRAALALQAAELDRLEQGAEPAVREPTTPTVVQQVSVDGAMIPLVGGAWAEVKTLAVGAVEATCESDGTSGARAVDLSYFSRLADAAPFTRQATVELARRGTEQAGVVVGVMDGAPWLQGFLDHHRPDAVRILDFPHAVEHLATAAQATFGTATPETTAWLDARAHDLKHTGPPPVLAALRALPVEQARDPTAAGAARDATLGYLETRDAQIAFPRFRAAGYPIGSGAVESANKLVVEARLKGSGMHWASAHVNPMLALRAVACNQRWAETWPAVCSHLRRQHYRHRLDRHRTRHPRSSSAPAPAASVPPAPTQPPTQDSSPRPKTIVNGRPTAAHPWRRLGSFARRPTAPKI
jgi:hypothetical protein